jgi:serine/threonine-protein kinase
MCYGLFMENMGRQEENLAMRRRAITLDPISPTAEAALVSALTRVGRPDDAVRRLRAVLELEPGFPLALSGQGMAYLARGRYAEAIEAFEAAPRDGSLGYAYAIAGRTADARVVLRGLEEASRTRYVSPWEPALVHAGLGEQDAALTWLERAYATRAVKLCMLKTEPRFDRLRTVPSFRALLTRLKLDGATRQPRPRRRRRHRARAGA